MDPRYQYDDRERGKHLPHLPSYSQTPYPPPFFTQPTHYIHPATGTGYVPTMPNYPYPSYPITPAPPYQYPTVMNLTPEQVQHFNASYGPPYNVRFEEHDATDTRKSSTGSEPRRSVLKNTSYQIQHVPMSQTMITPPQDDGQQTPHTASTFPRTYESPADAIREVSGKCRAFLRKAGVGNADEMEPLEAIVNTERLANASRDALPPVARRFLNKRHNMGVEEY
ncbi:hypothetical protein V5O48_013339 [Marasmius crinis-equi]|uniref:Uncharacterized protein n=1 Tax=Marasmius crinis-equi TaxID=585013 RepID=A0ABR3F0I1_9AGAR